MGEPTLWERLVRSVADAHDALGLPFLSKTHQDAWYHSRRFVEKADPDERDTPDGPPQDISRT